MKIELIPLVSNIADINLDEESRKEKLRQLLVMQWEMTETYINDGIRLCAHLSRSCVV